MISAQLIYACYVKNNYIAVVISSDTACNGAVAISLVLLLFDRRTTTKKPRSTIDGAKQQIEFKKLTAHIFRILPERAYNSPPSTTNTL